MEQQPLKDIPRTEQEAERQKGPIPLTAVFLALGLLVVLFLYYGPVWWDILQGDNSLVR